MSAYDQHQRLRTKAIRQIKKKAYDDAITTIGDGSVDMLKQKEQGSGCDLGVYLIDVYGQAKKPCDEATRSKVVEIISLAQNDFWRKKVIDAAVRWSAQASKNPAGDSRLRLEIAEVLAKEHSYFLAEAHYIAACVTPPPTSSSSVPEHAPKAFAIMMVEWLAQFAQEAAAQPGEDRQAAVIERIEAGKWALRGVIPLLSLKSPQAAKGFAGIFISRLASKHASSLLLPVEPNPRPYTAPAGAESAPAPPAGIQLYVTANPDLNFAQMALALSLHGKSIKSSGSRVPEGLRNAWVALVRQYEREGGPEGLLHEQAVGEAIPTISADYFDMQSQRPQGNFMQDMLSSLMGGGNQQQGGGRGQIAGTGPAKEEKIQALPIRQVSEPKVKDVKGTEDASNSQGEAVGSAAMEAPEEEELD